MDRFHDMPGAHQSAASSCEEVRSVLVLSARPVVADGLAGWLCGSRSWRLAGIVTERSFAVRAVREQRADIALVTDDMNTRIVLAGRLGDVGAATVIALSETGNASDEADLIRAGAAAVLPLPVLTQSRLLRALEDVRDGRRVLSADALSRLVGADPLGTLSTRQREVAVLLMQGHSVRFIAERLMITESTVKTHLQRISRRLSVSGREPLHDELSQLAGSEPIRVVDHTAPARRFVHSRMSDGDAHP